MVFESSLVNANISGDFKLSTVSNDFLHLIQSNHPKSYDLWISKFAKEPTNTFTNKNIDFDISIFVGKELVGWAAKPKIFAK